MPWAAAIPAVAAIGGALISSNAAGTAANAQKDATNKADELQRYMYDTTRADNQSALDARNTSLARLQELLGVGGNSSASGYGSLGGSIDVGDVTQDPGYQFGMQQGQSALQNQLVARGMRNSGAALQAGTRYAQDYAGTKYNDAFNRQVANRSAQLNPLQSLAGLGQTGASTIAQAGSNYANTVGNNLTSLGNAQGASSIAQGNALTGAINGVAGWYQNYQNQQNQQYNPGNAFNVSSSGGYTYQDPYSVGPN